MDFKELRKRAKRGKKTAPVPAAAVAGDDAPAVEVPAPVEVAPETTAGVDSFAGEAAADEIEDRQDILRFRLDREYFALYLGEIEEIVKPRDMTWVPRTPAWVLGIVSLRGTMVPVVDLRARLGLNARPGDTQRIIVVLHDGDPCGLLVDEVLNVESIWPDMVENIPAALTESAGGFLRGLVRLDERRRAEGQQEPAGAAAESDKKVDLIALVDLKAVLDLESRNHERAA